jgi:hypothetical protein
MTISELAPELVGCLRTKLGPAQVVAATVPEEPQAGSGAGALDGANALDSSTGTNGASGQ